MAKADTMDYDKFIYCLEAVPDSEVFRATEVYKNLEKLAAEQGIDSIYKVCDSIEGLEESLGTLLYEDHNFKDYEMVKLFFNAKLPNVPYVELDFMSKIYHDQAHVWFYHMTQDFPYCYKYASRWVSIFEKNEEIILIHGILYLKGLPGIPTV